MERLASGFGLIEGPVWAAGQGLMFSDVAGGGVFRLAADGTVELVFGHRRGIGGMALHERGGLVVGGRNIAFKPFDGGSTQVLLDRGANDGNVGYNDLATDAAGRIYVGSLGSPVFDRAAPIVPGALVLVDLDGSSRVVARDILLSNGLGFSPDGKTLYHSDSRRGSVCRYDVGANGHLGPKRVFARAEAGAPDGLAVSEDGAVWVAIAGAGNVTAFNPDGTLRRRFAVPLPMVTSVCFGGDDLGDLYVVTGSDGAQSDRAGTVFRVRVDVAGLPVPPARVSLPAA